MSDRLKVVRVQHTGITKDQIAAVFVSLMMATFAGVTRPGRRLCRPVSIVGELGGVNSMQWAGFGGSVAVGSLLGGLFAVAFALLVFVKNEPLAKTTKKERWGSGRRAFLRRRLRIDA